MTAQLDISVVEDHAGGFVAKVSGEVDLANVDTFRQALESGAQQGGTLSVDLTGVTYIDSAGIAVLFARAAHGPLEIRCSADSAVAPLIDITRLGDVASIRTE